MTTFPVSRCLYYLDIVGAELKLDIEFDGLIAKNIENAEPIKYLTADELPIEFFNHQLFDYNPSIDDDVIRFCKEWGFPFSPQRSAEYCLIDQKFDLYITSLGINQTCNLEKKYSILPGSYDAAFELNRQVNSHQVDSKAFLDNAFMLRSNICADTMGKTISLFEASATLYVLQKAVRTLMKIERANIADDVEINYVTRVLNAGTMFSNNIVKSLSEDVPIASSSNVSLQQRGNLTAAICNQIISTLVDDARWRECACDGCGRLFKRKQGKSLRPCRDSKYCCNQCMERQKKRNQREAARNRIQH